MSKKELLEEYIRFGGFPVVALTNYEESTAYQIINGIYHTVISRDIVKRHRINRQDLFDRVVRYIIENMGKTFSANSISKFLKNEYRTISVESIYNYLHWLEQAFIIYPCKRYDLQGKSILKTQEKYYLADVSLKYCLLGYNRKMLDAVIENIVFLELKRRGYDVFIGKNENKEIDFGYRRWHLGLDGIFGLCYSLFNLKVKINEQREYRSVVHYREPALVEVGMGQFREWVCEMQAERKQVGWAVIPALKDRILNLFLYP